MLKRPYALFLGDAPDQLAAKTAAGIFSWRRTWCLAQVQLDQCRAHFDIPLMTIEEAAAAGARTLVIGVANAGGVIPQTWVPVLVRAVEQGLDVASGLHQRLSDIPQLHNAAVVANRELIDVRHPTQTFDVGTGDPRSGKRLLTIGTDCSCGKMYTALAIDEELRRRGVASDFRATGQTGIFIAGSGVSVDAVVSDFISGAVEWLAPANEVKHWDVIEGQGSLFHPSYAGVSLGLLHGAQAEALVLCHEPTRTHMRGLPGRALPDIPECIAANEAAARLTNPNARCVGIAVNTSGMRSRDAEIYLQSLADRLGLPCVDPMSGGVASLVDRLAV